MKLYEARELIKTVFESAFDKNTYKLFIKNLLKNFEEKPFVYIGSRIPRAFENYIRKLERIGKFEDGEGNVIDILIVELKRDHSIEYARSTQRNFIRWYLAGSRGGQMKDAALVAFHSETSPDWRFSFIKMQYSLETKKDELTPAKRYSFLVGEKGKSHTAQQQLVKLLKSDDIPLLSHIEEAFNIETVTNEFFEKYKSLVFNLVEAIEKIIARDVVVKKEFESKNIPVIDFAKKLMGQIVFLYFLQRKGWLGLQNGQKYGEGDRNFLRSLYNMKKTNKNFFNDYLEYLFYDALSQKRVTDFYPRFNCRIPFLNGGLFDPIQFYDWKKTDIVISDELFTNTHKTKEGDIGDGILDVFDRYNFTVKEDEPLDKEVAVDPEMLGKVFERMLDVKERKSKGAFYTPREIVHYMSQESLIHYLDTAVNSQPVSFERLGSAQTQMVGNEVVKGQEELLIEHGRKPLVPKEDIETLIKHGEQFLENEEQVLRQGEETKTYKHKIPESIREHAKEIDQALENIRVCDPAVGSGAFPVGVMSEIVKARQILTPFVVRANGNSPLQRSTYALKSHCIHHNLYGVDIDPSAVAICKLRLWLSLVVDEQRIDVIEPLPNLDYKIVKGNSLIGMPDNVMRDVELEKEINDLMEKYYAETDKEAKRELKQVIDGKIKQLLKSAEQYTSYPIDFDFRLFFHEVFNEKAGPEQRRRGGFDVVIGNPPYVSHDKITNKEIFKTNFNTYEPFADIYVYFLEKGLSLQNKIGILNYITSNSYLRSDYGLPFRKFLRKKNNILEIINIDVFQIFDSAIVNTCILITQNKYNSNNKNCIVVSAVYSFQDDFNFFVNRNCFNYNQNDFTNKSWNLIPPRNLRIKRIIESGRTTLEEYGTKIRLGIATGANYAFIIDEKLKLSLIKKDSKNQEIIRPILRGRDIQRYFFKKPSLYILLTKNGIDVESKYPIIFDHLNSFDDKFKNRGTKGKHWTNLRACSFLDDFKKEKIIWIELSDRGRFALSEEEIYLLNSAYFLLPPKGLATKYLLGILNSSVIQFYLESIAETSGMGTNRWINNFVKEFPIPFSNFKTQKIIDIFVGYIMFLKKFEEDKLYFKLISPYFEQLIDGMVFELYFEEEIKKAGRDILKYLTNLTPITDDMSDEKKMEIITKTFNELYDKNHPVRQNLEGMDEIEEIRIIKGLDK